MASACADSAGPRQVRQHLRMAHRRCRSMPARLSFDKTLSAQEAPACDASAAAGIRRRLQSSVLDPRSSREPQMAIHRRNQHLMQTVRRAGLDARKTPAVSSRALGSRPIACSRTAGKAWRSSSRRSVTARDVGLSIFSPAYRRRAASAARSDALPGRGAGRKASYPTPVRQNRDEQLCARPSGQARSRASRIALVMAGVPVIRQPLAQRTRLHSSVGHAVFGDRDETH